MFDNVQFFRPGAHRSNADQLTIIFKHLKTTGHSLDTPIIFSGSFTPETEDEAIRLIWLARQRGWDTGYDGKHTPDEGPTFVIGSLFKPQDLTEELIQALGSLSPKRFAGWCVLPMDVARALIVANLLMEEENDEDFFPGDGLTMVDTFDRRFLN